MSVLTSHPLALQYFTKRQAAHLDTGLTFFGLFCFLLLLARMFTPILTGIWKYFVRPGKDTLRYGKWAIVTGATDGIGKEIAMQLASKGHSILLISRTQSRLNNVKKEVESKYKNVSVQTMAVDFSSPMSKSCQSALQSKLNELKDIGLLINNVGMGYPYPEYFHSLASDDVESLININMTSATQMIHLVIPFMLSKRKGCIVNISSYSSMISCPLLSEYSASKKYLDHFTKCLAAEYAYMGIDFQVQNPLFVSTKLAKIRKSSVTVPSPDVFAKSSVKAIGHELQIIPYWTHALQNAIMQHFPMSWIEKMTMNMHLGIRRRALEKKEVESSKIE